ncbi:MAG: ABC transporter ATP-binding protein/permease [Acholeplasmatales bacterium]|jgi:ATP-binding cassette subfamily B protein|nr:ABC transporter ATP-binding protein/permease [Acholeplasmatales bacterium]
MRGNRAPASATGKKKYDTKKVLGRILKYSKVFMIGITLSVIFAILSQVFNIIGPERIGKITNIISDEVQNMDNYNYIINAVDPTKITFLGYNFPSSAMDEIVKLGIFLVIIYVLSYVLQLLQGIIMTNTTLKMTKKLRTDIEAKINKLPLSYFDSRTTGDIMSIITNDVETFSQSINNSLTTVVSSITGIVGIGIMMFIVSWQLALINIIMIPIAFVFMFFTMKISQKHFRKNSKYTGLITGYVEESYTGHDVIKAFNAESERKEKFDELNENLKSAGWKSQFLSGILFPIMNFISNLSYLAVAVVGGLLATKGVIRIGDIQSMIMYSKRFSNPLVMIGQSLNMIQSALASADRIFTFLDEKEMEDEEKLNELPLEVKGAITFENVKFGYVPDKEIIHNFSLDVKSGERIAIVGPTGAGKTTIVNLLMKFYTINSGAIKIDGTNISTIKRNDVHRRFAMVLQDTWLFQGTIRDNLIYNQENISEEELINTCKLTHVHHFIKSLPNGYDTFIEDDSQVSSGQRQLLTIARAMLKRSEILILDEATSNVDTRTEVLIQDAMNTLMSGKTSFIIAHRLSTIRNASKILVLNNGDIVEIGTHEELLAKNGFYTSLYNSQFEGASNE